MSASRSEHSYGSDANGLICAFLLSAAAGSRALDTEQALAWLRCPAPARQGQFVWLHFNLSNSAAEKWMQAHLELPQAFYDALLDGSRSTRIENADDSLIAVINDVAFEFSFEPSEIATLWLTVRPDMLVSARSRPLRSIDRLRHTAREGARFASPMALLLHIMSDQGQVLTEIARKATLQVDAIEDGLLAGSLRHKRTDLGRLRRVFVRLQRLLAPEPAALFRLLQRPPRWIAEDDLNDMREATEEFSLAIRDVAALQERTRLLQEELAARLSEHTSRSLFVLTVVTVLALPVNILAGLMGMNVGGIPMAEDGNGFFKVVLFVSAVAAGITWIAMRRMRQ